MAARADLRRWVEGQRAAERRQRDELARSPLTPGQAFAQGLALAAFASRLQGWPIAESESDRRADLEAYDRWARLRRRLGKK
jgi:hypothetical protein